MIAALCALGAATARAQGTPPTTPATPPAPAPRLTKPPALTTFVEAPYPEAERAAGRSATVVLALVIGADGRVEEASVVESAGAAFDAAALGAARAFLFTPAELDGKPARVRILYRYAFTLRVEAPTVATFRGVVRTRSTGRSVADVRVAVAGVEGAATTKPRANSRLTRSRSGAAR